MVYPTDERTGEAVVSVKFQEYFLKNNPSVSGEFAEWLFSPSMLFQADAKWWGNRGKRDTAHEGLDIFLYRTRQGDIHSLNENSKVPVIFKGRIIRIAEDFLGKSVFVRHGQLTNNGKRLFTIYGHLNPTENIQAGVLLDDGENIGNIAGSGKRGRAVHPHLHISAAWIPDYLQPGDLAWNKTGGIAAVEFLDPLGIIRFPYSVIEEDLVN